MIVRCINVHLLLLLLFVCRVVQGASDASGFSKFEGKKKRQQTDKVSAVRSIFRKTATTAQPHGKLLIVVLTGYNVVFGKKHPLAFSFISVWKMFKLAQYFQEMFSRKQVFHQ